MYFNIHNLFKIGKVEGSEVILKYGAVAEAFANKKKLTISESEENLTNNLLYISTEQRSIIHSSQIMRSFDIIKSIEIEEQRYEWLKSSACEEVREIEMIEMGDLYLLNEQYDKAEKNYKAVRNSQVQKFACVRLAKLYF